MVPDSRAARERRACATSTDSSTGGAALGTGHQLAATVGTNVVHLFGAGRAKRALVTANEGVIRFSQVHFALLTMGFHGEHDRSSSSFNATNGFSFIPPEHWIQNKIHFRITEWSHLHHDPSAASGTGDQGFGFTDTRGISRMTGLNLKSTGSPGRLPQTPSSVDANKRTNSAPAAHIVSLPSQSIWRWSGS